MESRPISPAEPTNKRPLLVQPNAHPYAIKTTSSALLSRSNSSPHSAHHTRHHYVPSRIPTGTRGRHQQSSSLSSIQTKAHGDVRAIPAPLPTPPSAPVASPDNLSIPLQPTDDPKVTHRTRRAETMPVSSATTSTVRHHRDQKLKYGHNQDYGPGLSAGLAPSPKLWNTDELVSYLESSFGSGNTTEEDKDDSLVGILEGVRTLGLTGRELLRLTDMDLAGAPLSDAQRAQLLECSRILRADFLRGHIYVDSYHAHQVSENSNDIYSVHSSTSFYSARGASLSVDDLRSLPDDSTSEEASPPSPAVSLHRSNSVSDASAQRYRDLARMRMRRRGKVKGLIETWERTNTSGSEYSTSEEESVSGSEVESESETGPGFESISGTKSSPAPQSSLLSAEHDEPLHGVRSPTANSTSIPQEPPLSTPPPPYAHMSPSPRVIYVEEEEPTMEELLASSASIPLKGARAWEADFGLGETVKRIPASSFVETDGSRSKGDDGQTRGNSVRLEGRGARSTKSSGKNAKAQQRVVTAIFAGHSFDDSQSASGEMALIDHHPSQGHVNSVVCEKAPTSSESQDDSVDALRALEESIAATRAQVEAFRLRLEEIEADTTKREAELERARYSDSCHFSEPEFRRRGSEANKQEALEKAEPPKGETLAEGFGNKYDLRGWETMSVGDIARAIVSRALVWVFPYGHVGTPTRKDEVRPQDHPTSRPGVDNKYPSPAKRSRRLSLVHMSCRIIFVSFAICASVLRGVVFGRWVRRP